MRIFIFRASLGFSVIFGSSAGAVNCAKYFTDREIPEAELALIRTHLDPREMATLAMHQKRRLDAQIQLARRLAQSTELTLAPAAPAALTKWWADRLAKLTRPFRRGRARRFLSRTELAYARAVNDGVRAENRIRRAYARAALAHGRAVDDPYYNNLFESADPFLRALVHVGLLDEHLPKAARYLAAVAGTKDAEPIGFERTVELERLRLVSETIGLLIDAEHFAPPIYADPLMARISRAQLVRSSADWANVVTPGALPTGAWFILLTRFEELQKQLPRLHAHYDEILRAIVSRQNEVILRLEDAVREFADSGAPL